MMGDGFIKSGQDHSTGSTLFFITFGPLVWAGQLTLLYGGHTLICFYGGAALLADLLVIGISMPLALMLLVFIARPDRSARALQMRNLPPTRGRPIGSIARLLAVLSLVAVLWTGSTAWLVSACTQGR